jgi:two-component system, NtrC family, response regulator HydG
MTGRRLTLVADDKTLASTLQVHLGRIVGHPVARYGYTSVRQHLANEPECFLLAIANRADAEAAYRLVQEIHLQRLPALLVLLDASSGSACIPDSLDPYVSQRLTWPEAANALGNLLRDRLGRPRGLGDRPETIEDLLSRRLLLHTPSLLPLVERIALAAAYDVTVLLTGETGTGKTHLARLLHDCSPRRDAPFMTVACGALTSNLIESTFFGHVRGAFTGAVDNKIGKFEAVGNGTLLLDEIDTLGLEQQAALLRVIENREFEPVGSNETRYCLGRVVVASNWDLETAVRQGRFREDLYYRLNVMSFHLPPLRERLSDIGALVRGIVGRYNTQHRKDLFEVSRETLDVLEAFPWPGNIRQLDNVLQSAVLCSRGPILLPEHLPPGIREQVPVVARPSLVQSREQTERNAILRTLASYDNSRSRAAKALGISRVTLYKKMKKYGLMVEAPLQEKS